MSNKGPVTEVTTGFNPSSAGVTNIGLMFWFYTGSSNTFKPSARLKYTFFG